MEEKKIYKCLANIMADVKYIGKNQRNTAQGFNFRGIDDVMNELHGLFAREHVIIVPNVESYNVEEKITERTFNGQVKRTSLFYTRATITYAFVAEDGSQVETKVVGEAMDSGDKGMNKAMSIALKYALMQMLLIPTKEPKDPDAESHVVICDVPSDIRMKIEEAKTKEDVYAIWKKYPEHQGNPLFKQFCIERKDQIK